MKALLWVFAAILTYGFSGGDRAFAGRARVSLLDSLNEPEGQLPSRSAKITVSGTEFPYDESGLSSAIAIAGTGSMVVPKGTIVLSSTLKIPSASRIYWDGVTLASNGYPGDLVLLEGTQNVSFEGQLIIDGAGSSEASISYGVDLVDVSNFSFGAIRVTNTRNGCIQMLGSSHIHGDSFVGTNCGRGNSTSAGFFAANSDALPLTDLSVDQIEIDGAHNSDCVYFSGTAQQPSLRINVSKIDLQKCGDTGLELNYAQQANIGQVTVAREGALNSGVLVRQTTDDNISSVACAGEIKLCVDVATLSDSDGPIERVTIGQVVAKDVSRDLENGAAVRVFSSPRAPVSNVIFDSIIAANSSRGFYCSGTGGGHSTSREIIVGNIIVYGSHRDGIYFLGCSGVLLENVIAYDNGQEKRGFAAIRGSSSTDIVVGNARLFDDQTRKTQTYGLFTDGSSDRWTIGNIDARDDLEINSGLALAGANNTFVGPVIQTRPSTKARGAVHP